jgi:hypothetical protein
VDVRWLADQARAGGGRKRQRLDPQQLQQANADNPRQAKASAGGAPPAAAAQQPPAAAQQQQKGFAGAAPGAAGGAGPGGQPGGLGLSSKGLPHGAAAGVKAGSGGWDTTGWHAKRGEFDFEYDQVGCDCAVVCVVV